MFYEVTIKAAHGGFGEYDCLPINGEGWADQQDLLDEISGNYDSMFELTDEIVANALPGQAEDIRGRIHNEPARVFAIVHDDNTVTYFGVVEK